MWHKNSFNSNCLNLVWNFVFKFMFGHCLNFVSFLQRIILNNTVTEMFGKAVYTWRWLIQLTLRVGLSTLQETDKSKLELETQYTSSSFFRFINFKSQTKYNSFRNARIKKANKLSLLRFSSKSRFKLKSFGAAPSTNGLQNTHAHNAFCAEKNEARNNI